MSEQERRLAQERMARQRRPMLPSDSFTRRREEFDREFDQHMRFVRRFAVVAFVVKVLLAVAVLGGAFALAWRWLG